MARARSRSSSMASVGSSTLPTKRASWKKSASQNVPSMTSRTMPGHSRVAVSCGNQSRVLPRGFQRLTQPLRGGETKTPYGRRRGGHTATGAPRTTPRRSSAPVTDSWEG